MSIISGAGNSFTGIAAGVKGLGDQVIGGIYTNKAAKSANPTDPRDPYAEARSMLAAQTGTAQDQYDAYAKYSNLYAGIDSATASNQFGSSASMYGQYSSQIDALNNASNTAYRQSAIDDAARYGGTIAQQYRDLNPELYASLTALDSPGQYETAYGNIAGAGADSSTRISAMLGQQAESDLALGGQLSDAELRTAQQAARSAGAARGLYDSNNTIGAEILNTYNLSNQRLNERRAFASDVMAQNAGQLQSADAMNQNRAALSANAWTANRYDPYSGILGQNSTNQLSSYQIAALNANTNAYNQQATRSQFDPYNAYAQNIYGGAYDAQNQANLAQASIYSGLGLASYNAGAQGMRDSWSYMSKGSDQIGAGIGGLMAGMG
jgi:hypothetical protein